MLGDLINRCLILALGYAYPAFECYKVVEKNRVEMEELRFWCKYWIIVAILTVLERVADVFISWLPMYGELKLAFFIYLWYPKIKGTEYVYHTMLRPYLSKHETDIDRKILEMKARVRDLGIFYWQNFAQLGQEKFFDILKFLAGQSSKYSNTKSQNQKNGQQNPAPSAPPLPPDGIDSPRTETPVNSSTVNRAVSEPTKSNLAQVNRRVPSKPASPDDGHIPDSPDTPNENLLQARLKLRRQKPEN